jgi:DNA-binding transcriptional MerR regulator
MDYIENFIKAKSKDGNLYLTDIYDFLNTRFRVPIRTFQWYVQETLLPAPKYEGRVGFYYEKVGSIVLERIRLIKSLKEYDVKFSTIKKIFDRNEGKDDALIDRLSTVIESYPLFERGADPDEPVYNWQNAKTIQKYCERLAGGGDLEQIKVLDIEE